MCTQSNILYVNNWTLSLSEPVRMNEMTKQPKGMSLTLDVGLRRRPLQYRFMPVLSKSKEVKFDHCIFLHFIVVKYSNLSTVLIVC